MAILYALQMGWVISVMDDVCWGRSRMQESDMMKSADKGRGG